MLIDLYNGVEKRTGRTAEDTDSLRPGDFRLGYLLVPLRQDGYILWKKNAEGLSCFSSFVPAGESSLAAALTEARFLLGAQVEVSALRLLSHQMDREEGLIVFDRSNAGVPLTGTENNVNSRVCEIGAKDSIEFDLFLDVSSLEVFLEGGRHTMTGNVYPDPATAKGIRFFAEGGNATFVDLEKYDII